MILLTSHKKKNIIWGKYVLNYEVEKVKKF